jgi:hypothetical protein
MTVTHCLLLAGVCFVTGANVGVLFLEAIKRRIQHQWSPTTSTTTQKIEALAERFAARGKSIMFRDRPSTATDMLLAVRILRRLIQSGAIRHFITLDDDARARPWRLIAKSSRPRNVCKKVAEGATPGSPA